MRLTFNLQVDLHSQKNAFNLLMTKTKGNVPLKQVTNKKDEFFNNLVNLKQLTCYQEQLQNINVLIQCLTDALWLLDGNHNKLNKAYSNDHCFQLPQYFAKIYQKEYYDWKNRKRAKPTLTHEKMLTCSNKSFDAVSLWDNVKFPAAQLVNASCCLLECMRSYANHLKKAQERMTANRLSNQAATDKFIMPNPINVKPSELKAAYDSVNNYMESIEHYTPINIDNIIAEFNVPEDRKQRYVWFKDFQICHRYGPFLFRQILGGYFLSIFSYLLSYFLIF